MRPSSDGKAEGPDGAGAARVLPFGGRELAFLVAWPWVLVGLVAFTATGASHGTRGGPAATVLAAGIALFAFVGAPALAAGLEMTERAGTLAVLCGALALPALVAATLASPSAAGTVPCGALLVMLAAYALVRAAALTGEAYPAVAVLWIGGPPFVHYLLRDVLERRADWLLGLGPASGAAWTVLAPSAWGRVWWPAFVLATAGAVLTLLGRGDAPEMRAPASGSR
ncbi:MAG: hypothetical protein ACYTKD_30065 [Planctomycetota bacterium]|jgi:hypothetical protein